MHKLATAMAFIVAVAILIASGRSSAGTVLPDAATQKMIADLGLRESAVPVSEMKGWRKPRRIVVWIDQLTRLQMLREAAPGVVLVAVRSPAEALEVIPDADALVGFCDADVLRAAPALWWIHTSSAGVDSCVAIPEVRSGRYLLTNMQRIYGPTIADHAMALMFGLARGLDVYLANQHRQVWDSPEDNAGFAGPDDAVPPERAWEIQGKTMLVVGLGGIGTEVARRAHALGMRVIAIRNSSHQGPDFVEYVGLANELGRLLGQADVVVDALPLTPETAGTFDAAMFARMKPTSYFINVGRGKTVVTDDLIAALKEKRILGAGLDVMDPEPLPPGHALWTAPNLILTPHAAAVSFANYERFWLLVRENIRRYVAGEKMLSVVDVTQGY